MAIPHAVLSDHRFGNPLRAEDRFNQIEIVTGAVDLEALKQDAEGRATRKIDEARKSVSPAHHNPERTREELWHVMMLNDYRNGSRAQAEEGKETITRPILDAVAAKQQLEITFSFFPIKILNPLKTFAQNGTEVDIGEVGVILRLYEMARVMSAFYRKGVQFVVAADGAKYHDVIGFDHGAVIGFRNNIQKIIDALGVGEYVSIIDETELYPENYHEERKRVIDSVRKDYDNGDSAVLKVVETLRRNMSLCIPVDTAIPLEKLAAVFSTELTDESARTSLPDVFELRESIRSRVLDAIIGYEGAYRYPYEIDAFGGRWHERRGTRPLKASVHAKPGQWGLYSLSKATHGIFAHHGQGFLSPGKPQSLGFIRTGFRADLARGNRMQGIRLDPKQYPFSNGEHPFVLIDPNRETPGPRIVEETV